MLSDLSGEGLGTVVDLTYLFAWTRDGGFRPISGFRPIRLVLLDDHVLFRESLARLLASDPGLELVAECTTPSETLKSLKGSKVDVLLVDIRSSQ